MKIKSQPPFGNVVAAASASFSMILLPMGNGPDGRGNDRFVGSAVKTKEVVVGGAPQSRSWSSRPVAWRWTDAPPNKTTSSHAPSAPPVNVRTESCNAGPDSEACASAIGVCVVRSGNPNYYYPPQAVFTRTGNGAWQASGVSCGPPSAVTVPAPGGGAPVTVTFQPPPVPTFAEIQQAYRRLPFSKPRAVIQPVGGKTLINLPTYYAASWPDDAGLKPGEVSAPLQLLSWSVEFKVTAKEYRYVYGDGSTSPWTTSTGGAYPDGDIRHTYTETGTVGVRVDARLTGQYRVDGGPWLDIDTTADLQDEPTTQLQVLGTKTRLTQS